MDVLTANANDLVSITESVTIGGFPPSVKPSTVASILENAICSQYQGCSVVDASGAIIESNSAALMARGDNTSNLFIYVGAGVGALLVVSIAIFCCMMKLSRRSIKSRISDMVQTRRLEVKMEMQKEEDIRALGFDLGGSSSDALPMSLALEYKPAALGTYDQGQRSSLMHGQRSSVPLGSTDRSPKRPLVSTNLRGSPLASPPPSPPEDKPIEGTSSTDAEVNNRNWSYLRYSLVVIGLAAATFVAVALTMYGAWSTETHHAVAGMHQRQLQQSQFVKLRFNVLDASGSTVKEMLAVHLGVGEVSHRLPIPAAPFAHLDNSRYCLSCLASYLLLVQ